MMEPLNSCSLGAMGSLLRKLDELLRTEERAKGLIGDLRIISTKMKKLSEVHSPPHTVKYWMNDARELSYDMEVCVDLFVHASQPEDLPAKVVAWDLAWIKEILGFEARVKEVNERCERYNLVNRYVLLSNPAKILVSRHLRTQYEEPDPVGMEEPTNKILEWLMPKGHGEEDLKLKVVSVLGDEGAGKSTLVKRIWRLSEGKFDCQAFVQTAKKPDTRMILRSILSQVRPKQPLKVCKVPKLVSDLREHLQDKRYFIVIGNLWDLSVWHIIKRAFPAGNQRIITTTAVENVAHVCCSYDSNSIVNVKCLGTDQAKNLFIDRAFGSEKGCPPQFNDFTDEITRKCGGFPLAIICTARLVASQPETEQEQQLDYVTKFLPNNLSTHSSSMEILNQVLKLCYSSLPHCLKTCLLDLSVYPENYLLLKEDLVKQWIAEDFICTPEGKDIVDVAGSYFDQLLSLGLIQRMDIVNSNKKGSLSYTVHPAVFDFITCKSMEDNFITIIDYSQSTVVLSEKVRRLALHFGSATYATTPESVELSQVRSLSFIGLLGCMPLIAEFKLVRVMMLHICSDDVDTRFSLSDICNLLQLRYLQVRCNVTVELPIKMQCLKHLETLEINAGVESVPLDIVHLPRLLHIHLGKKSSPNPAFSLVDWNLLPCSSISLQSFVLLPPICILSGLPLWFRQLHKLRRMEIVFRQLSNDIDALAELPVLKHLSLYVRTPPTAAIILSSGMFPALEYFKFACGVLSLGFQKGTLPNLCRLKLVFNAHKREQYGILVGISHLLSLQKVVASIGLAPGAEESDRIAAGSAFKDAIRQHQCHRSFEVVVKRVDQVDEDWNQQEGSSNERGQVPLWKLAFRTPPELPIFTGSKIEDEAGNPLEVILVDADTGSPAVLPQALRVELVPVFGDFPPEGREDWSADEFQRNVVKERHGKRPLLTGDVSLTMTDGRATVGELQFTDNSSWVRCSMFRIGARVVPASYDGGRIVEAITEAFVVRDHRGDLYRKHYPPVEADREKRPSREIVDKLNKLETVRKSLTGQNTASLVPTELTYQKLEDITNTFSEEHKVGSGGYGNVYRGVLDNGTEIAIKKLHQIIGLDDVQFKKEFNNLMKVHHKNIIRLIAYCFEIRHTHVKDDKGEYVFARIEHRALCFEYFKRGSLDKHLSDESCGLDWHIRYKIIKGICEGLDYLHNNSKDPMQHLDLKPANILLDENFVPKIADFGLSKLFGHTKTYTTKTFIGTLGYMPPEYIEKRRISMKYDVFSLGVIILQVIAGPSGHSKRDEVSPEQFIEDVKENWKKRLQGTSSYTLILQKAYNLEVETCVEIALRSVEADREKRPTIREIVDKLNKLETVRKSLTGQNSEYKLERLAIDPLEVRFPFEVDRDVSCVLQLTNRSPDFVAFTALANQSRYRTVPGRGVMPPWSKLYVVATLQAQGSPPANMRCDDLFVVQSAMVIGRREGSAAVVDDDVVEGLENMMGEAVEEVRLPIVYVAIREQQDTNS